MPMRKNLKQLVPSAAADREGNDYPGHSIWPFKNKIFTDETRAERI
jgi:hypothetical protein